MAKNKLSLQGSTVLVTGAAGGTVSDRHPRMHSLTREIEK